jgi:hypothetical protein
MHRSLCRINPTFACGARQDDDGPSRAVSVQSSHFVSAVSSSASRARPNAPPCDWAPLLPQALNAIFSSWIQRLRGNRCRPRNLRFGLKLGLQSTGNCFGGRRLEGNDAIPVYRVLEARLESRLRHEVYRTIERFLQALAKRFQASGITEAPGHYAPIEPYSHIDIGIERCFRLARRSRTRTGSRRQAGGTPARTL